MTTATPSVLITGANGFVGARLCRIFLAENFHVIAGVRKSSDLSNLNEVEVEYRYGDVTDRDSLPQMVQGADYVIHNAGIVKAKKAEQFFEVNEIGTKNLLEALLAHNPDVKKVLYISSQAAAGPSIGNNPVTETDEPSPMTVYGKSKLAGERMVLSYKDKLPVVAVRPPGIYGPGDKEIFSFFQTLHSRVKPYIGDISRKIQLVHVDDLCRGLFLAISKTTETGSVYFIAENRSYSMKELIGLLRMAIGRKAIPVYIPSSLFKLIAWFSETLFKIVGATPMLTVEKSKELLASWELSIDKAKRELGYESEIPFVRGAKETYNWYVKEGWL